MTASYLQTSNFNCGVFGEINHRVFEKMASIIKKFNQRYDLWKNKRIPSSRIKEEFLVSRTSEVLRYTESKDPKVRGTQIEVRTGRKWSASKELAVAEEKLRQKPLVGVMAKGRTRLGFFPSIGYDKAHRKERRQSLQNEVRAGVEEDCYCKMVGLCQQGAWTK